jgi:hypothetical protein
MADEKPNQPSRAEQIRKDSAAKQKETIEAFGLALTSPKDQQVGKFLHAFGLAIVWGISALPEIAAQLAEANERDREAEIRAKNAEGFVAGIQAELARQQIVIPGGAVQIKPPRGR